MPFNYQHRLLITALRFVLWAVLLFGLLPRWLFPTIRRAGWRAVLRMAFYTVFIVHLLSLAGIYDVFSLSLAYLFVLLGETSWQLGRFPRRELETFWQSVVLVGISIVEFGLAWRARLRGTLSAPRVRLANLRPPTSTWAWGITLGWLLVIAGYLGVLEPLTNPAPAAPYYSHLRLLKNLDRMELYAEGVYPAGAHALISAVNRYALLENGIVLRALDGLAPLLVLGAVLAVGTGFSQGRGGALLAAAAVTLLPAASILPAPALNVSDRLPLLFGMAGLLLTTAALVRFIHRRARADATLFAMGVALTTLTHPLAAGLILVPLAAALPAAVAARYLHIGRARWLALGLFAGFALAGVVYAVGFLGGRAPHPQMLDLLLGNLGQSWFELWGFAFETPTITLQLNTLGLPVALLLCASALPGGERGLARGVVGFTIFGLAILRQPSALSLPEILAPGFLALALTPFICLGIGLAFDAAVSLVRRVWDALRRWLEWSGNLPWPGWVGEWAGFALGTALLFWAALPIRVQTPPKVEYNQAVSVLYEIKSSFQPYTWTLISYDEDLPHVLGSGWYLQGEYFVENYAPETFAYDRQQPELGVPTPFVFIMVEQFPYASAATARTYTKRKQSARDLSDWVARYEQTHTGSTTFYQSNEIVVYLIEQEIK